MTSPRLPAALAVFVVLVAGCTGTLAEVHSTPATIPPDAHTPAGYVHGNTTEVPLSYPLGVGPVSRDITVYVWVSGYSRTVESSDGNETAGLLVVSSPNRKIEGQSISPFAQLSNRKLVGELFDLVAAAGVVPGTNVTEVVTLRETGVQNRTVLGQRAEVVTYTATVRAAPAVTPDGSPPGSDDGTTTLFVHLLAVEHGEDVVFALGVHDDGMDEGATMADLMAAIEHETAS